MPRITCTMKQVGLAMINCVAKGYPTIVVEVKDIRRLAEG
jgi:hypothetical protein